MTYIRLTVVRPHSGHESDAADLLRQLNEAAALSPGCLSTYLMRSDDDSGDLARIAVYRDEASAEHAASNDHIMALRSRLHLLVEPGHSERAFDTI